MDAINNHQRASQPCDGGGTANAAVPPEAPVEMVEQSLWLSPTAESHLPTIPRLMWLRRALVLGSTISLTAIAAYQMYLVVTVNGPTVLQTIVLVLYVALFAWIAFSFVTMLVGFILFVFVPFSTLTIHPEEPLPEIASRCALLVPTYNETPHRLFARVQAILESVELTGQIAQFDFFVLSDTTDRKSG